MADTVVSAPGAHADIGPPVAIERPDFEIVPRNGLILVAIATLLLIVAIASDKLWPLEFLHVTAGAAWTIIDLFLGLVLGPIMGRMSIPARIELACTNSARWPRAALRTCPADTSSSAAALGVCSG